jgi:hypothetical protein
VEKNLEKKNTTSLSRDADNFVAASANIATASNCIETASNNSMTASNKLSASSDKFVMVVAIDLGTTYSGYAFA